MALSIRQMDIVNLAKASGRVEVDDLASRFDVSVQTIRRDLGELADQGLVDRVHGGAVLPSGVANLGYEARRLLHQEAKETVGRLCAARIPDNSSLIRCSAMDADGDVLDYDLAEVRVSRTILRQARSRLLVTDLSKLGRSAPIKVVSLAELDAIVTEAPLPDALRERCAGWETECVSA